MKSKERLMIRREDSTVYKTMIMFVYSPLLLLPAAAALLTLSN